MERIVNTEYATFLTQAGLERMGQVMRGEATISFAKCRVGDGLWDVTQTKPPQDGSPAEFSVDVPEALLQPLAQGEFDIESLTANGSGVTEVRVNIPEGFGPATINEAAWLLDDGTVYAITRTLR